VGHVCSDNNPKNISVNTNTGYIGFLDTDSYHIQDGVDTYRCDVGIPEYLPFEIQIKMRGGGSLVTAVLPTFSQDTDNFALAIHIFQLLMNGCHPFACAIIPSNQSTTAPQPSDNILKGQFPFMVSIPGARIPSYAPEISVLPKEIQNLFKRAFIDGHLNPKVRPSTVEWHKALRRLRTELKTCKTISYHQYHKSLSKCPWCEINNTYDQKRTFKQLLSQTSIKLISHFSVPNIQSSPTPQPSYKPPPKSYPRTQNVNNFTQVDWPFLDMHIRQIIDADISTQHVGKNVLIEGIRGTGKTRTLDKVVDKCCEKYCDLKVLPVYISLINLLEFSDSKDVENMRLFRLHFYVTIVLNSVNFIKANKELFNVTQYKSSKITRIATLFGIETNNDFQYTIEQVAESANKVLNYFKSNHEYLERTIDTATSAFEVKAGNLASYKKERGKEQTIERVCRELSSDNAITIIQEYFKELKDILGLSYSLILVDDCSETNNQNQIEVFRLLKAIRNLKYIYFIATSNPPPFTYYPSQKKGDAFNFDLGHDASVVYLQLDETSDEYEHFFVEATMEWCLKNHIDLNNHKKPSHLNMFATEDAFILAAYAANGIQGRYIKIFEQARANTRTPDVKDSKTQKISLKDVETAIMCIVSQNILTRDNWSKKDFQILNKIVSSIKNRNNQQNSGNREKETVPTTIYFTVPHAQVNKLTNLIVSGVLHEKARTRVTNFCQDTSKGELFSLDLAVAIYYKVINSDQIAEFFKKNLKSNAEQGYVYRLEFDSLFRAVNHDK
jgi:hypothetical protein